MNTSTEIKGLHLLKDELTQWEYLCDHSESVLKNFDEHVKATYDDAPVRQKEFKLDREGAGRPKGKEAKWERAIWQLWGPAFPSEAWFLPGICKSIQTYQLPLFPTRDTPHWRAIDLVGVDGHGLPVVLELKEPGSEDTPLFMMLEAAAYGICVMKNWKAGPLRREWKKRVTVSDKTASKGSLKQIKLVGLAPEGYWQGLSKKKQEYLQEADKHLNKMIRAMKEHGLIWHFATLQGAKEIQVKRYICHQQPSS